MSSCVLFVFLFVTAASLAQTANVQFIAWDGWQNPARDIYVQGLIYPSSASPVLVLNALEHKGLFRPSDIKPLSEAFTKASSTETTLWSYPVLEVEWIVGNNPAVSVGTWRKLEWNVFMPDRLIVLGCAQWAKMKDLSELQVWNAELRARCRRAFMNNARRSTAEEKAVWEATATSREYRAGNDYEHAYQDITGLLTTWKLSPSLDRKLVARVADEEFETAKRIDRLRQKPLCSRAVEHIKLIAPDRSQYLNQNTFGSDNAHYQFRLADALECADRTTEALALYKLAGTVGVTRAESSFRIARLRVAEAYDCANAMGGATGVRKCVPKIQEAVAAIADARPLEPDDRNHEVAYANVKVLYLRYFAEGRSVSLRDQLRAAAENYLSSVPDSVYANDVRQVLTRVPAAVPGGSPAITPSAVTTSPARPASSVAEQARKAFLEGEEYDRQSNNSKSLAAFREAVRLEPNNAEYQYRLGHVYHMMDDWAHAIPPYREATRLSSHSEYFVSFGYVLVKFGGYQEAIRIFERAFVLGDNGPWTRVHYAEALAGVGRIKDARTQLELAIQSDPSNDLIRRERDKFVKQHP